MTAMLIISDKKDFERVFREHYSKLVNYAIRMVRDTEQSEDLVQQVFVNLWEKRFELEISESLNSYLLRSTHNACLNLIKHHKVRQEHASFVKHDSDEGNFEDVLESEELRQLVHEAVKDLPKACRRIFLMSRLQGKKYRQIAEELGISEKTVENQMGKALKTLRDALNTELHETMRVIRTIFWLCVGVELSSVVIQ